MRALDILVKQSGSRIFAMIECKTWGEEYEKERNRLIEDGGQLFSYAIQEQTAKYLILYTSRIVLGNQSQATKNRIQVAKAIPDTLGLSKIEFETESIDWSELCGKNRKELHQFWDKNFLTGNIFVPSASCFHIKNVEIKKIDLKELDDKTGKGLFHSFAEILRRHAISDKSNAFNKIFNLFVCKIYDEDSHHSDDILDFQWKPNDDYRKLISRLSTLYQRGIVDYLQLSIEKSYFSPYSEFAFLDIYNKDSYDKNFKIVREIVELLQRYQIKYTEKHQFLGDFFEDLLNAGIKQEAGQFFTPTPLARFFVRSMPIENFVNVAVENNRRNLLPVVVDFACGAGHFLTEAIDEIESVITNTDFDNLSGHSKVRFDAIRNNFYWAKDYIYGIEKDYRLSKTTKIAMFLNGDGEATIINGDGLGSFSGDRSFRKLLNSDTPIKELSNFDIVISNPPFSISGFTKDIRGGETDFDLFSRLSQKSSEIECLFLERAHQILKTDGLLGIILPLSILNNKSSIYIGARRILLMSFKLVSIVELRDKTFKPTNTTTVALFARKRNHEEIKNATKKVLELTQSKCSNYVEDIAKYLNTNSNDLIGAIQNEKETLQVLARNGTLESILAINNLLFNVIRCVLDWELNIYVGYSGEKKDQEHFLGYRFWKRRGQEGVEILRDDKGYIDSRLYDKNSRDNPNKLAYYIHKAFMHEFPDVSESLDKYLKVVRLAHITSNDNDLVIDNPSKYFGSRHIPLNSISPLGDFIDEFPQREISLKTLKKKGLLHYTPGLTYSKSDAEVPYETSKRVLTASNISLESGTIDLTEKLIYLKDDFVIPDQLGPKANDIIISKSSGSIKHLGKVAWVDENLDNHVVGGFLGIYRFKDIKLAKAVYYRFMSKKFRQFVASLRGQNINNLDLNKIDQNSITVPRDLDKFMEELKIRQSSAR